jgi:hypothetical protein
VVLLGLCLAIASVGDAAPAPPSPRVLAVAPLSIEGPLPEAFRAQADERVLAGSRRGSLHAIALADRKAHECEDATCLGRIAAAAAADWVLVPTLTVGAEQRDYRFAGRIVDARGRELFVIEEGCELCGFEEAIGLVEDRLASAAERLTRDDEVATAVVSGTPEGAAVAIDGRPVGRLPLQHRVSAGPHEVAVSKPGFLAQAFEIDFPPGARRAIEVRLPVDPTVETDARARRRGRALVGSGAAIGVASLAAIATGGVLVGIHRRPYRGDCQPDIEGNCRHLYGTRGGGIAALVTGSVGLAVGVALVVIGRRSAPVRAR